MTNNPQVLSDKELTLLSQNVFFGLNAELCRKIQGTIDHERALREKVEQACYEWAQSYEKLQSELSTEKALRVQAEAELHKEKYFYSEKNITANIFMNQVKKLQTKEYDIQHQLLACQIEKERMREALKLCQPCPYCGFNKGHDVGCRIGAALTSSTPSSVLEDLGKIAKQVRHGKCCMLSYTGALEDDDCSCGASEALALAAKHGLGKGGE